MEVGVIGTAAPEIRTQFLFRDKLIGVARVGHPLLTAAVSPESYAACDHIVASKDKDAIEPIDAALEKLGLKRTIRVVVPGFPDAMRIVRQSDLVALVPRSCLGNNLTADPTVTSGLATFQLPVSTPEFNVSATWHPRMDADPAHRWLRDTVMSVCRAAYPR